MTGEDRPIVSRWAMEAATALALLGVGAAVVSGALEYQIGWDDAGPQPGYFPFFIGLIIVACSAGVLGQALLAHRPAGEAFLGRAQAARVAGFFLPVVAFVLACLVLGIYASAALYLAAVMWLQGRYNPALAALVGVGIAAAFFVLFEILFRQSLLKGPIEAALGLS